MEFVPQVVLQVVRLWDFSVSESGVRADEKGGDF